MNINTHHGHSSRVSACPADHCAVTSWWTHTAPLNRIETKDICLIIYLPLSDCLQPFKVCCSVASLAIFYHYFHANCSSTLADCMPPPLLWSCCTRFLAQSHPNAVQPLNAKVNQYHRSSILFTGKVWNSPTSAVFPPSSELISFKRGVLRYPWN